MKKIIQTDKAPKAIGAYSQAIRIGNFLFTSGQIPLDPVSGELKLFDGDIKKQTQLVMSNLKGILESEGLTFDNVIKTTIFLSNMDDFAKVNEIYAGYFCEYKPARSCVQVARLPKEVSVEIEMIASV